jgi:hypothetical protein
MAAHRRDGPKVRRGDLARSIASRNYNRSWRGFFAVWVAR